MFSTEEHWRFFAEFCELEIKSGGPDPQLATVQGMSARQPQAERIWRAGCYIAVYNVGYAEALWRQWPATKSVLLSELRKHWPKITTRVERRCVRRPEWMHEFLQGYRKFAKGYPELRKECATLPPLEAYVHAWDTALKVPRLGRYVALKLLEYLRRYEGLPILPPDIRPRGGWSPRETLATLWERPEVAEEGDKPQTLALVNQLCDATLQRLELDYGLLLDLFQLQVMLCEYRESWEGKRQYPGRSLDSELKYARKAEKDWGYNSGIWSVRKKLFPHQHLGELNGWDGPREGPASALASHKYTWTDLNYDFKQTYDFAQPTLWGEEPKLPVVKAPTAKRPAANRTKSVRVYTVIEEVLFQSGRWTGVDEDACRELVKKYQLTGIANFWKDDPRLAQVVPWYRWWPLPDGKQIPDAVTFMAEEILAQLRNGGRILTMCYGGRNRSGLLSALTAQRWYDCNGAEAVKVVKAARKGALVNPYFVSYLEASPAIARLY